jgi:flagellar FliL protein
MADKKGAKEDEEEKDPAEEGKEEGAEGSEEGDAKSKSKRKKMIIIAAAAAVILLGGGGAGVYFSGVLSKPVQTEPVQKKGKKKKGAGGEEAERGSTGSSVKAVKQNPNEWVPGIVPGHDGEDSVYYNLPEFLVNLDTNSKQTSFIKMKVTLEAPSDGDNADAIDNRLPRIIDKFNTYLRLLRTSDIAGSAGLYRLREELLLQVNKEIYPSKVNDILFQEIIVQ